MSAARATDWLSDNRAASVDKEVKRGERGKFCFSVRAPATPSTITEHFGLVQEGVAWFADSGGPADDALWLKITATDAPLADTGVVVEEDATPPADSGADAELSESGPTTEADPAALDGSCGCRAAGAGDRALTPAAALMALLLVRTRRSGRGRWSGRASARPAPSTRRRCE